MSEISYFNPEDFDLKEMDTRLQTLRRAFDEAGLSTAAPYKSKDGQGYLFLAKDGVSGNKIRLYFAAYSQAIGLAAFNDRVLRIIPADDSHDKMKYPFNTAAFCFPGADPDYNVVKDNCAAVAKSLQKFLATGQDSFIAGSLCME